MTSETQFVRTIDLGYDQMFVFESGPQSRVRVLFGSTWLTQEGRPDDEVVRAGDEVPLHGGRALMQALGPTRVQIVTAARRSLVQRVQPWLRRTARRARQLFVRLHLGQTAAETPS